MESKGEQKNNVDLVGEYSLGIEPQEMHPAATWMKLLFGF